MKWIMFSWNEVFQIFSNGIGQIIKAQCFSESDRLKFFADLSEYLVYYYPSPYNLEINLNFQNSKYNM